MTPEAKIKNWVDAYMKRYFPDAIKYSPPGVGLFGKNGMPDRIWWIEAVPGETCITVAIETKAGNNDLSALQDKMLRKMSRIGILAAKVHGKDYEKMERIRNEIFRRIRLANEGKNPPPVRSPETDGGVSDPQ